MTDEPAILRCPECGVSWLAGDAPRHVIGCSPIKKMEPRHDERALKSVYDLGYRQGLQYASAHTSSEIAAELARLKSEHDTAGKAAEAKHGHF